MSDEQVLSVLAFIESLERIEANLLGQRNARDRPESDK
jgi:hypothetical protein